MLQVFWGFLQHFTSMTIDVAGVLSVSPTFHFHDYWCYRCFEGFSNISLPWLLMLQVFWAFLQHFTSMTINVTGALSVSPTFHFHDYWCYRCFEGFSNISLPWLLMLQVLWAFLQHFTSMTIDVAGVLSVSSTFHFHDYWCCRCFEGFSNISLPWLLMLQVFWAFLQACEREGEQADTEAPWRLYDGGPGVGRIWLPLEGVYTQLIPDF